MVTNMLIHNILSRFNRRRDLMNKQRRGSPSFIEISSKPLTFKLLRSSMLNYEDNKTEEQKSLIKSAADVSDSDAYTDTEMADSDNVNVKHGKIRLNNVKLVK